MSKLYKIDHYAVMCRSKSFKTSVRHFEHEEEDECTLGSVTGSETADSDCTGVVHDKEDLWYARILILGKPVEVGKGKAKKDPKLKPDWTVRNELTVEDRFLLFQTLLVIPTSLQEDILQRRRQEHQGIVKCRALVRNCLWWPNISQQIERKISDCPVYERETNLHPEPLQPTPTPDYPAPTPDYPTPTPDYPTPTPDYPTPTPDYPTPTPDYPTPTPDYPLQSWDGHFGMEKKSLSIVDYYYSYETNTPSTVIEHIKSSFARHGIPDIVVSYNGPQFRSWDFVQFAKSYCFTHLRSSPLRPLGNGEAEKAVTSFKMMLRKADDKRIALLNYHSTPVQHGSSSAELLMGRK